MSIYALYDDDTDGMIGSFADLSEAFRRGSEVGVGVRIINDLIAMIAE